MPGCLSFLPKVKLFAELSKPRLAAYVQFAALRVVISPSITAAQTRVLVEQQLERRKKGVDTLAAVQEAGQQNARDNSNGQNRASRRHEENVHAGAAPGKTRAKVLRTLVWLNVLARQRFTGTGALSPQVIIELRACAPDGCRPARNRWKQQSRVFAVKRERACGPTFSSGT